MIMQVFRKICSTGSYEFQVSGSFNGVLHGTVIRYTAGFTQILSTCTAGISVNKLTSNGWKEVGVNSHKRDLESYIKELELMISSGSHVLPIRSVIDNIKECIA